MFFFTVYLFYLEWLFINKLEGQKLLLYRMDYPRIQVCIILAYQITNAFHIR